MYDITAYEAVTAVPKSGFLISLLERLDPSDAVMSSQGRSRSEFRRRLYQSYVSDHQGTLDESRSHASLERHILRHVSHEPDLAILDVGCGQGQLVRALRARGHKHVTGIDVSREQVDLARALGTEGVQEAELFEFAGEHRRQYDYVVALDVVEHFDRQDVVRLFDTLQSMVRPGGCVILRTPNGVSPFHGRILFGDVTHGLAYTSRSLEQIGAAAGYERVATYPCRPAGNGMKQIARRVIWRIVEALLTIALAAETGEWRRHVLTQNLIAVLTVPSVSV